MFSLLIHSSEGLFLATYSEKGLAELHFPSDYSIEISAAPPFVDEWHSLTSAAVHAILSARVPNLLPPLDLSIHTEFQRSVWHHLRQIPLGRTLSYSELALLLGSPGAARAVGGACGANPIPLIIPCHRVLAANHALGGFSGGLHWKRKLLALEGIDFTQPNQPKNRKSTGVLQGELSFSSPSTLF